MSPREPQVPFRSGHGHGCLVIRPHGESCQLTSWVTSVLCTFSVSPNQDALPQTFLGPLCHCECSPSHLPRAHPRTPSSCPPCVSV